MRNISQRKMNADGSHTPTAEILSGKNAQAWVSMVLYLKKIN